jgi:hypothetical protein
MLPRVLLAEEAAQVDGSSGEVDYTPISLLKPLRPNHKSLLADVQSQLGKYWRHQSLATARIRVAQRSIWL